MFCSQTVVNLLHYINCKRWTWHCHDLRQRHPILNQKNAHHYLYSLPWNAAVCILYKAKRPEKRDSLDKRPFGTDRIAHIVTWPAAKLTAALDRVLACRFRPRTLFFHPLLLLACLFSKTLLKVPVRFMENAFFLVGYKISWLSYFSTAYRGNCVSSAFYLNT